MAGKSLSMLLVGFAAGVLAATVGFSLVVRNQAGAGGVVLKLAHSMEQTHPVHLAMVDMAKRLADKSGGQMRIEIAPNGQLGGETECLELLQHDALDMTKVSTAPLEAFVATMAVYGVPYVFRNEQHYWDVLRGDIGRELMADCESVGLHALCYYDAGARSFYTIETPILEPADLKGLKIRVQNSNMSIELVKALGGAPTPMPFGELYTGLQQGVVDGAENNPPSFYAKRHYEVCKHYSLNEHSRSPDILLISENQWDALTDQQRQWLAEAARESSDFERELWKTSTQEALAAVQEAGVQVHRPDRAPFAERVQGMHEAYSGTPLGDLIDRIKAVE